MQRGYHLSQMRFLIWVLEESRLVHAAIMTLFLCCCAVHMHILLLQSSVEREEDLSVVHAYDS